MPNTFATVAALKQSKEHGLRVTITATGLTYNWVPLDDSTGDDFAVIDMGGGSAGRFRAEATSGKLNDVAIDTSSPAGQDGLATYLRTVKTYTPKGTIADAAAIQALVTAIAGTGEVQIKPGSAIISSAIRPPAGDNKRTILTMHPNAVLVNQQSPDQAGQQAGSAIYAPSGSLGAGLALAAAPVVGTSSISMAAITDGTNNLVVNGYLRIGALGHDNGMIARIRAITGSGPYAVTLDRPVTMPFKSTALVFPTVPLVNFVMRGGQITGAGDRCIELVSPYGADLEDIQMSSSTQGALAAITSCLGLDVGTFRARLKKITIDGNGLAQYGAIFESLDDFEIDNLEARGCTVMGALIYTARKARLLHLRMHDNAVGLGVEATIGGTDITNWIPTDGLTIEDAICETNAGVGMQIDGGSANVRVLASSASYNGSHGIWVGTPAAGGNTRKISLDGCATNGNTLDGLRVDQGVVGFRHEGHVSRGNGGSNYNISARGAQSADVRQPSSWIPSDESICSYDMDPSHVVKDGGNLISVVSDLSVAGIRSLTQGTGANKPTWNASGRGGRPFARFDGSTSNLVMTNPTPLGAQDWLVVAAIDLRAAGGAQALLGTTDGASTLDVVLSAFDDNTSVGWYDDTAWRHAGVLSTGFQLVAWELKASGTNGRVYVNGVQLGAAAISTSRGLYATTYIGTGAGGTFGYMNADLYELHVFPNPTDALRNKRVLDYFLRTFATIAIPSFTWLP